jgi:cyclopropane fatty-acyl-phospholipid synthase-like methyltransferase
MSETYEEYLSRSKAYYNERFGAKRGEGYQPHEEERIRWTHIEAAVAAFAEKRGTPLHILDFGCGSGWMSHLLARFGQVTGIDLSNDAVEKAKAHYPGIDFVCVDASDDLGKVLNRKFDVVVSSEVLEHVMKQDEYIANLASLLSDGGKLVMTTPNGAWKEHFYLGDRKAWMQPYEFWLTAGELQAATERWFENAEVYSFNAGWVLDLRSFGMPNLLGNRLWHLAIRVLGLKRAYLRFLERRGYGINLMFTGFKKGGTTGTA